MPILSPHIERMDRACLKVFGEDVVYAPAVGSPVTVKGIFDESYVDVEEGMAGVESAGPAVVLRVSDLPGDPTQDKPTLTIRGKAYKPRKRKKNTEGGIRLLLNRVGA